MSPELLTLVPEVEQKQATQPWRVSSELSWRPFQRPSSDRLLQSSQQCCRTSFIISNLLLLKVTNLVSVSSTEPRLIYMCLTVLSKFKHIGSFNPQNNLIRLNMTLSKSLTLYRLQFPQLQTGANNSPVPVLGTIPGAFTCISSHHRPTISSFFKRGLSYRNTK